MTRRTPNPTRPTPATGDDNDSIVSRLFRPKMVYTYPILPILGNIMLSLLFVVATLLATEYISRMNIDVLNPIYDRYPSDSSRTPYPYVMHKGSPNEDDRNEGGFPGPFPSKNKPDKEYRIFLFGGSTVYQHDPSIAEGIETISRQHGKNTVKVYNFGVISFASTQELILLLTEASALSPDLVIFYDGANDIHHPYDWDPRPGYPFNFIVTEHNPLLTEHFPLLESFFFNSTLLRKFGQRMFLDAIVPLRKTRESVNYGSETWRQSIADIYVQNIVKASRVASAFDSRFIAFFQPTLCYGKTVTDTERQTYDDGACSHFRKMRPLILKAARNKADMPVFVDLSSLFDTSTDTVFKDIVHIYPDDQQVVSEAIYTSLVSHALLP